jgi:hypothetical protein
MKWLASIFTGAVHTVITDEGTIGKPLMEGKIQHIWRKK